MSIINEESFDITKCRRLSQFSEKIIRQYETSTGASINVTTEQNATKLTISGNSSQFRKAKVLIRDSLESSSFIPTVYYYILAGSVSNNDKLRFVKFDEEIIDINDDGGGGDDDDDDSLEDSGRETRYFVEFLQKNNETDGDDDAENFLDLITPCHFNISSKIDDCLERLCLKVKTTIKRSFAFPDKIIFKPELYFGKVLYFDIINPGDTFVLQEWYRFNILSKHGGSESIDDYSFNGELYNNRTVNTEFLQGSTQIEENFRILQQKFGFKLESDQFFHEQNKGKISIFYTTEFKRRRKIKLHWSELENKWKIIINAHGLNRLANIDIISGSKEPDFRLSLKTFYDLPPEGSEIEEAINKVQSRTFSKKNNMWFESEDFNDTLIKKAVVRQVIEKKRYKNEKFSITISKVKQDKEGKITIQNFIILKHLFWKQNICLDNVDEFMKSVTETFHYAQELMNTRFDSI
ncbi:hypothetical protein RclHR1_16550003 [Rhizophagus clarus]|uniref:K Homology domain-containing protein n=1 Tax=Rhizophagus clarus TaxID=94130 RepID=A0A2Z6RAL1_9GLOM|nr:hypothetical protein RclHR1_16550003 [Rhizophagus clarus]